MLELGARLSHWRGERCWLLYLRFPSLLQYLANREIRSRMRHTSSLCNCSRRRSAKIHHSHSRLGLDQCGRRYHCLDPGAYPDYARASSYAATTGNVLTQRVRILDFFCEQVLTNPVNNRKLSGGVLLALRSRATVDCKKLWDGVTENYKFCTDL